MRQIVIMRKKILILGYGYTAQYLTKLLIKNNDLVIATTRQTIPKGSSTKTSVNLIPFNEDEIGAAIKKSNYILISTPPNHNGTDPAFSVIKEQLINCKSSIKWVGYLSATNVYGDHNGEWVNEDSALNTPGEMGARRIKAEKSWLSLYDEHKLAIHIFRLAGIYGPNRNRLVNLLQGKRCALVKKGHVVSRIHVEDISCVLYASMTCPTPGEIYNVADDFPCATEEVDTFATRLLHQSTLRSVPVEQSVIAKQSKAFYQGCKRVSNQKIKDKLSFKLLYPSYEQGLLALYEQLELLVDTTESS